MLPHNSDLCTCMSCVLKRLQTILGAIPVEAEEN